MDESVDTMARNQLRNLDEDNVKKEHECEDSEDNHVE